MKISNDNCETCWINVTDAQKQNKNTLNFTAISEHLSQSYIDFASEIVTIGSWLIPDSIS
jgi:hypothetical protein